jgi:hypothetical protein
VLLAASALASGSPPHFLHERLKQEIYATRVAIEPWMEPNGPTTWQAEYSTSESGPWTVAGSGTTNGNSGESGPLFIGVIAVETGQAGNHVHYLRHLAPNTAYYARFKAQNASGTAEEIVVVKTLPVGRPEIARADSAVGTPGGTTFRVTSATSTTAGFTAQVETDGAATEYRFEVSPSEHGPFTPCGTGTISVVEEFAFPEVVCSGLTPETKYFPRVRAINEKGEAIQSQLGRNESFTTPTAKPVVVPREIRNVTATSAHFSGDVLPHGSETSWRLESATSQSGPWTPVPGASGTVSQAQAEALPFDRAVEINHKLSGLSPSTTYYVRLFAKSPAGEGLVCHDEPVAGANEEFCEAISTATHGITSFETSGPPTATTFATHAVHGGSMRLLGAVNPNSLRTSDEQVITVEGTPTAGTFTLTFRGLTPTPIAFDATASAVQNALTALPEEPQVFVGGNPGSYTVEFLGKSGGAAQPQIEANGSQLKPSGTVTVTTTQQGGEAYDTRYHFEYVSQAAFAEHGWAEAATGPVVDAGSGDIAQVAGLDLPGLTPGETYRYRVVATNTSPGNPVVDGAEQTLTVPGAPAAGGPESCPNEALRVGASANLPDCRAYEQLTPVGKEGAQEIFQYSGGFDAGFLPEAQGEHAMLAAEAVDWGSGPSAGKSPYFFSRESAGWQMKAAAKQPEAGVNRISSQVFDPHLGQFAFSSGFNTFGVQSSELQFMAGPPGGPYTTVATVPRKQVGASGGGWVGASADFSELILAVQDRNLVEPQTTTKSGLDLYEYSGGELRQANVGVGECGAKIVHGFEEGAGGLTVSGPHSVSADGSRVFFEAVPGSNCSELKHLYVRIGGRETRDLGTVSFLAANEAGTEVLLEKAGGENHEVLLYEAEAGSETHLLTLRRPLAPETLKVSAGATLTTFYLAAKESLTPEAPASGERQQDLYRYDIPARRLDFVAQATPSSASELLASVSADGRYAYFGAEAVGGVPGGGTIVQGQRTGFTANQVYRYDNSERVIECVSCASAFNPEPKLIATLNASNYGRELPTGGVASNTSVSADGNFALFTTPAALVPQDVDGEIAPEEEDLAGGRKGEFFSVDSATTPSSDIYEWRRPGIDGCSQLQGCLALITNGRGGYQNMLLGSAHEGRDVFIYTHSQLVSQDNDSAGDIYDVRIGGGFASPPPRPVECEGDACSTPFVAPSEPTPSSFSFQGAGNLLASVPAPEAKPAAPNPKPKKACRPTRKRKCKAKAKKRSAKRARRRAAGRRGGKR